MSGAKLDKWPKLLNAHMKSCVGRPFEWGVHDCFLFWVGCERVMYGDSVFDDIELIYDSEEGASEILASHDCSDVWDAAEKRLTRIEVDDVEFGDLVGHVVKGSKAFGVAVEGGFVAPAGDKLIRLGKGRIKAAWRR